jgi:hypothetical protein
MSENCTDMMVDKCCCMTLRNEYISTFIFIRAPHCVLSGVMDMSVQQLDRVEIGHLDGLPYTNFHFFSILAYV